MINIREKGEKQSDVKQPLDNEKERNHWCTEQVKACRDTEALYPLVPIFASPAAPVVALLKSTDLEGFKPPQCAVPLKWNYLRLYGFMGDLLFYTDEYLV